MHRLLAQLIRISTAILPILVILPACGPPKDMPAPAPITLKESPEEAETQKDLIGTWKVSLDGKDGGKLSILDEKRFVLVQRDPSDRSIQVKLSGSYYVDGQKVIRFIEKAEVTGGPLSRRAEIRGRAVEAIEKPQLASIEWRGKNKFMFRDESGKEATYERTLKKP
ncbi:MAG: hypothetical protein WAO58_04570 [Fimbriimonadaceae bacterium]